MDWKTIGEKWNEMLSEQKNVYIQIGDKEYTIWWIESGDEQIDLMPTSTEVRGTPGVEMLVSDLELLSLVEGYWGDEYIPLVFETVMNKENWVSVLYVEIASKESSMTCMKIVKESDPLPENATGRYLKTGDGGFEFK